MVTPPFRIKNQFPLWKKLGIIGLLVGVASYFAVVQIYNNFSDFGTKCIPPGEPFLTCGPDLVKSYYFFFHGQRDPILVFLVNLFFWSSFFTIIGVIYSKIMSYYFKTNH